jgi:hypothetical protein
MLREVKHSRSKRTRSAQLSKDSSGSSHAPTEHNENYGFTDAHTGKGCFYYSGLVKVFSRKENVYL